MAEVKIWTLWNEEELTTEEAELLRRRAGDLPIPLDGAAKRDVETVLNTFLARNDAAGLAAPQIGISRRIIVFRTRNFGTGIPPLKNGPDYEVLINPRITQVRGEMVKETEGCLSCPDINVDVERADEIKVRAYDRTGAKINKRYTGFLARVVQHEIDHLDGKLIIDRGATVYYSKEKEAFFDRIFKGN